MKNPRVIPAFVFASGIFLGCAFLVGCGSGGNSSTPPQTIASSGNNVASISVNGGLDGFYADAAFVSVTVCVPGTSTCQTIDNVLVDTGSSGLRILSSALTTLSLPQQTSGGNPVVECFPFVSGYTWGPVQTADVKIAGEKASSAPIQVLSDNFTAPSGCTGFGASQNTALDANGIVGVGLFTQDCGDYCTVVQTASGNPNLYYECSSSSVCEPVAESLAEQVPNPVSLFSTDNNGVIVELPAVSAGGETSVSGSLVFGIGTQSNNALGAATIYTADDSGSFTTTYKGTAYADSFIDSGSNGYYFLDSSLTGITECNDAPGFYCPASTVNISATNQGQNGNSGSITFSIENADTLFNSNDAAYSDLGGISGTVAPYYFDLGLPFFFGRNLYTGLQSATYANGYWAY
jgi:predicted aspartyl protease